MATPLGFSDISTLLAAHLLAAYPGGAGSVPAPTICHDWQDFANGTGASGRLLLYLFHVEADPAARSANLPARVPDGGVREEAAFWQLFYLLAASADDALRAQDVLQVAAMRLHRGPLLTMPQSSDHQVLACVPQHFTQEEMRGLWRSLGRPLQASLVYRVPVTSR